MKCVAFELKQVEKEGTVYFSIDARVREVLNEIEKKGIAGDYVTATCFRKYRPCCNIPLNEGSSSLNECLQVS